VEAVWEGLPVLTLPHVRMAGRVGSKSVSFTRVEGGGWVGVPVSVPGTQTDSQRDTREIPTMHTHHFRA
jgi:hypothetical protein